MGVKITIKDIAVQAGVSVATVSRVLNHKSIVTEDTRLRVQQAMLDLGMEIDDIVLRGADSPSKKILLNLPSLSNPYYNDIVRGAQDSAVKRGYYVMINSQHMNQNFSSYIYMVKHLDIEGVIMLNALTDEEAAMLNEETELVQCAEFNSDVPDISYVGVDNVTATIKVMEHIIATGRRKIALISGPGRYLYSRERRKGYIAAMERAGIPLNSNWVVQLPSVDFQMAYSSCISLFNSDDRPDALMTLSDVFALAAIKAAKTVGIRVPEDLVVTGFDDVDFAGYTTPSITTIRQPMYQMGYIAAEILIDKIEKKNNNIQKVILDTELIVRESSFAH